jgi:hypothetical protein
MASARLAYGAALSRAYRRVGARYQVLGALVAIMVRPSGQAAGPNIYASPGPRANVRTCRWAATSGIGVGCRGVGVHVGEAWLPAAQLVIGQGDHVQVAARHQAHDRMALGHSRQCRLCIAETITVRKRSAPSKADVCVCRLACAPRVALCCSMAGRSGSGRCR